MFGRTRKAMRVVDGDLPESVLDAAGRREAQAFREVSEAVRASEAGRAAAAGLPDFEAVFAGVEARVEAAEREAGRTGWRAWLRALVRHRPLWVLAPAGAAIMAFVLGWVMLSGEPARPDNTCFVDSYDADRGSVFVDQDPDDPSQATVIWVLDGEEG